MNKNQIILLFVTILALVLSILLLTRVFKYYSENRIQRNFDIQIMDKQASPSANFKELAKVNRVVDGDTIELLIDNKNIKLRYIGINTPETVDPRKAVECFGKEASKKNKSLVENKIVYLEKDISDTDKYGRLLRYVYLKLDDGSMLFVNDYLVREGFAYASSFPPDVKYAKKFLEAQSDAENNKRGLWNSCR